MLETNDQAIIRQMINLLHTLAGSEDIKSAISSMLIGVKGLAFCKGLNKYSKLDFHDPLREALVYSLLKASGKWKNKKALGLKDLTRN